MHRAGKTLTNIIAYTVYVCHHTLTHPQRIQCFVSKENFPFILLRDTRRHQISSLPQVYIWIKKQKKQCAIKTIQI